MKIKIFDGPDLSAAEKKANTWLEGKAVKLSGTFVSVATVKVPGTKQGKPATKSFPMFYVSLQYEPRG